jgi:Protein of unknown function (DUF2905)
MVELGKLLIVLGGMVVIVGGLILYSGRLHLGHLPGDIVYHSGRTSFYFPLGTCILVSVILSLGFWLYHRLR